MPRKALDQSSRGLWYFEHLNLAYRAAQMQGLTQVDGFYHTFCSTSILSPFLFMGPYNGGGGGREPAKALFFSF